MQALLRIPYVQTILKELVMSLPPQCTTSDYPPFALPLQFDKYPRSPFYVCFFFYFFLRIPTTFFWLWHKLCKWVQQDYHRTESLTALRLQLCFHVPLRVYWCCDSCFYFVLGSSATDQLDVLFLFIHIVMTVSMHTVMTVFILDEFVIQMVAPVVRIKPSPQRGCADVPW